MHDKVLYNVNVWQSIGMNFVGFLYHNALQMSLLWECIVKGFTIGTNTK